MSKNESNGNKGSNNTGKTILIDNRNPPIAGRLKVKPPKPPKPNK